MIPDECINNYKSLSAEIKDIAVSAGRLESSVRLVAVSKRQSIEKMQFLIDFCEQDSLVPPVFGESYLQEFEKKKDLLRGDYRVHMIAPLQSNKIRKAVELFDVIESVHSIKTAEIVNKESLKAGKVMKVFLQVNISADEDKKGFSPEELLSFVQEKLQDLKGISVQGFMTITRRYDEKEAVRRDFQKMKTLVDKIIAEDEARFQDSEISMGMSGDYNIAVEEGATLVRVGTAVFGER